MTADADRNRTNSLISLIKHLRGEYQRERLDHILLTKILTSVDKPAPNFTDTETWPQHLHRQLFVDGKNTEVSLVIFLKTRPEEVYRSDYTMCRKVFGTNSYRFSNSSLVLDQRQVQNLMSPGHISFYEALFTSAKLCALGLKCQLQGYFIIFSDGLF